MTPTTEQRERVARARGWKYEPNHGPAGWVRFHDKHGDIDYEFSENCPDYETVPTLNCELEIEAMLRTDYCEYDYCGWYSVAVSQFDDDVAAELDFHDNPLTARFYAYLAWMEEN